MAKCSFCDREIVPASGRMYVKKDGTTFYFCSMKCNKNQLKLKRSLVKTHWTGRHMQIKEQGKKHAKAEEKGAEKTKEK